MNNNNEIIMDLEDYKSILTHNGKIDGIVGTCKINEFNKNLEPIKNSIKKAKGILIKFGIHRNQSLFIINDYMSQIHDLTINDAEIIFGTENIDNIDEDFLRYEIIITGIE
jgi:cell division GTPase FtsZ